MNENFDRGARQSSRGQSRDTYVGQGGQSGQGSRSGRTRTEQPPLYGSAHRNTPPAARNDAGYGYAADARSSGVPRTAGPRNTNGGAAQNTYSDLSGTIQNGTSARSGTVQSRNGSSARSGRGSVTRHSTDRIKKKNKNTSQKHGRKKSSLPKWLLLPDSGNDEDIIRIKGSFDRPLLIIVLALIGFGLIMVFSASYVYALSKTGDSLYYIKRQLLFALLGIIAMIFAMNIDYRVLYRFSAPAFIATSILLVLTPLYGMAAGVATRWIDIGGVRFQPSEIMKLVLVLFLSRYFMIYEKAATNPNDRTQSSVYGLFVPGAYVLFVCILIALENHFSCMIIMFSIGMVVIFVAGARMFWFAVAGSVAAVAALIAIMFSSYARERIDVWLRPEKYSADDEVYQTLQGLYAIGSGGFLGTGLGNSRQKHLFVSQPQNDFIYTIVCEELGFVGAVGVIALFLLLIWRGCVIALRAPDTFSQLVVVGIIGKVAIQSLLNIGVVTACLPNTGISLPFFSYGGTALAMQIMEMGIVLGISRYSRRM